MKKNKLTRKQLKYWAKLSCESFNNDPVHKYVTENEKLIRYYVNAMGADGNRLVTISENEGKYANDDGTLIEQLWVHIYDFDKLTEVK